MSNGCDGCNSCDCNTGPFAIWRHMDGENVFTGIVTDKRDGGGAFKKLDDARGELDGAGHVMERSELLSQFSLYDGSSVECVQKPIDVCVFAEKEDVDEGDMRFFDNYMENANEPGFEPIDFFPHDDVTRVRADDVVLLKANGVGVDPGGTSVPAVERFWAHVVSVTPCGKVTAVPRARLHWSRVTPDQPILLPIEAVMAVKHGIYWKCPTAE